MTNEKALEELALEYLDQNFQGGGPYLFSEAKKDLLSALHKAAAMEREKWRRYADHTYKCKKAMAGNYQPHLEPCTCGLDELRKNNP